MSKVYAVNEIFYSLQGEGYFTGTPAVFLRLSGCNLDCPFCDTDHTASELLGLAEIVERLTAYPSRHLVITGGEPSLQADDLLADVLHEAGFYIQIETNGTHPLPEAIDWVTCSPKSGGAVVLNRIDELKVVYAEDTDPEETASMLPAATHYFLQPCSGKNIDETVSYVLSHPYWRLSLQTHKLINIQ